MLQRYKNILTKHLQPAIPYIYTYTIIYTYTLYIIYSYPHLMTPLPPSRCRLVRV